jgi:hypothetical protein
MHEGPALAETSADPVAQTLKRRIGGYRKNGNHDAAAEVRRELDVHHLEKHVGQVAPVLTLDERARIIREIADSAPLLTAEDAAMLRGLLPLGAPEAVARAS